MAATLLMALVALSSAACSEPGASFDRVGIDTQDGPPGGSACPDTWIEGLLALSDGETIGIARSPGGRVQHVVWPPGYGAARTPAGIVLLDERDEVIAHVGDRVRSGGWAQEGGWFACRPVVLETAAPG